MLSDMSKLSTLPTPSLPIRSVARRRPTTFLPPRALSEQRLRRQNKERVKPEDDSTYHRLQRYLESLYDFPLAYRLNVIEKSLTTEVDTQPERTNPPPDDYYVNFGKAIEAIKEDFPQLFYRDFDYSIFREDLVFRDPINTFQGLRFYKYMLLSLRWHGRIFFKRVAVRIHSLWPREEGTIRVRWSIHAIPRIPWEAEGILDGVSVYKLDSHGKIYEHSVDNIIFRDPPMFRLPVLFAELSTAQRSRNPIPSAWCRCEQCLDDCYYVHRFSWIRLYFILSVVMSVLKLCPEPNELSHGGTQST